MGILKYFIENLNLAINHLVSVFSKDGALQRINMSIKDVSVNSGNGFLGWSEHSENSEVSLETLVNVERTSLGIHGTEEKNILKDFSLF